MNFIFAVAPLTSYIRTMRLNSSASCCPPSPTSLALSAPPPAVTTRSPTARSNPGGDFGTDQCATFRPRNTPTGPPMPNASAMLTTPFPTTPSPTSAPSKWTSHRPPPPRLARRTLLSCYNPTTSFTPHLPSHLPNSPPPCASLSKRFTPSLHPTRPSWQRQQKNV